MLSLPRCQTWELRETTSPLHVCNICMSFHLQFDRIYRETHPDQRAPYLSHLLNTFSTKGASCACSQHLTTASSTRPHGPWWTSRQFDMDGATSHALLCSAPPSKSQKGSGSYFWLSQLELHHPNSLIHYPPRYIHILHTCTCTARNPPPFPPPPPPSC